jgi:5-dehydro-4-deoxyglucarate dehydratase
MVMKAADSRLNLDGVIAFPVTPFKDDLSLNVPGLRRNVQAILKHPIAAIVAAGGTGELYSLTPSEHLAVVDAIVDEAKGRIPVIAGTGFGAALGVQLAQQAAQAGASGILAFPPYYPQADDEGLLAYYRAIAASTPLGLIIYSRDWFHPSPEFVARLAEIPTLVAWKDGQGDIRRLQAIMQRVGSRLHWIGGAGDDLVPAYYALGVRAFTSSVANVAPAMALQLHTAASNGDAAVLQQVMREYVIPLYALRGRRRGYEVTIMKALMDRVGLAGGKVRPPLAELSSQDAAEVFALAPRWLEMLAG